MKFTEEKLEQAVIELFEAESYKHFTGEQIHNTDAVRPSHLFA